MPTQPPLRTERVFADPADKFWSLYLSYAEKEDDERVESWKSKLYRCEQFMTSTKSLADITRGDADGILIFSGLFTATVAAFIIESYKKLSPDSSDQTVELLRWQSNAIIAQVSGSPLPSLPVDDFHVSKNAIIVNALWFLSLVMTLICALAATLVQQWARRYLADVRREVSLRKRAHIQYVLSCAVDQYAFRDMTSAITLLLHFAVFLFLTGLVIYLLPINVNTAATVCAAVGTAGAAYLFLCILSIFSPASPFQMSMSKALVYAVRFLVGLPISLLRFVLELFDIEKLLDPITTLLEFCASYLRNPRTTRLGELARVQVFKMVQRSALRADEIHELESLFDVLPTVVHCTKTLGIPTSPRLPHELTGDVYKQLAMFMMTTLKTPNIADSVVLRRISIGTRALRSIAAAEGSIGWDAYFEYSDMLYRKPHLAKRSFYGAEFLLNIHAASIKFEYPHFISSPVSIGYYPAWFMVSQLHGTASCIPCQTSTYPPLFSYASRSVEADLQFISNHRRVGATLRLLTIVLNSSNDTVAKYEEDWQACLALLETQNLPCLPYLPLSREFKVVFKRAGLARWLDHGATFDEDPVGGDVDQMRRLREYPKLLEAMRDLALSVLGNRLEELEQQQVIEAPQRPASELPDNYHAAIPLMDATGHSSMEVAPASASGERVNIFGPQLEDPSSLTGNADQGIGAAQDFELNVLAPPVSPAAANEQASDDLRFSHSPGEVATAQAVVSDEASIPGSYPAPTGDGTGRATGNGGENAPV